MNSNSAPRLPKLPFLIGDILLLVTAWWLAWQGGPLKTWTAVLVVAAVALGAWIAVAPFIMQFRADVKTAETSDLASATEQLGDLATLAQQISSASMEWQGIHKNTSQTIAAADQIAEKMISESRNFGEVLTRMNDTEKTHLRLELEKFKRSEGDWLQVVVRLFDHIYAVEEAAARSTQRNVAEQLSRFQNSCRDVARRIGFLSIVPQPGVPFDEKEHHLIEGQTKSPNALVGAVLAPGYSYQGQLLRLPAVSLKVPTEETAATQAESEPQLPFGNAPTANS